MDIGRWKALRPPSSRPKPPTILSSSPIATSGNQASSPALKVTIGNAYNNGAIGKPMSPASPSTPKPKSTATGTIARTPAQSSILQKVLSVPTLQVAQSTSKGPGPRPEPYPESKNVPLKLREIFSKGSIR
jgi:hypothetical protein